ncbi:MAG: thioredoxin family protein [Anaerolineales bacterium]|nr:thioredoxin family protein [Anaerolineales bacterium]
MVHKFAFESAQITAEAVSAVVMVELAQHYGVMGTPHLVLNGVDHVRGRVDEEQLLASIQSLNAS